MQADAVEYARHAASIGADAIAAVPPYYEKPTTWQQVIDFFTPVRSLASHPSVSSRSFPFSCCADANRCNALGG